MIDWVPAMFERLHAWCASRLVSVPHKGLVFSSYRRHSPHVGTLSSTVEELTESGLEEEYVTPDWVGVGLADGDWAGAVEVVVADERLTGKVA